MERIRAAMLADASPIASLVSELGYPTLESEMRERLERFENRPAYQTFVAQMGTTVVGVVGVGVSPFYEHNGIYARLLILAVREDQRGNGLGRALVEQAETWAESQGATTMIVNSGNHRAGAHRFYGRVGYSSTGLRFVKHLTEKIRK